jgi:hypothetical protein
MVKPRISTKHLQISKANTIITATVAIASFITVASLVAMRSMLQTRSLQSKVISDKELAVKTLKQNIEAVDTLEVAYKEFVGRPNNIIGGSSTGSGDRDGDNAKLVLDALPSKYDFPALTTSIEKVLTQSNFKIIEISGIDDEVAQGGKTSEMPEVVEMPFSFTIGGGYDAMHDLIKSLERSIRPIQIKTLEFKADSGGLQLTVEAKSFYQSAKEFNITTKAVQ